MTPHSSCLLNYLTAAFPFSFRLAQYFFILSDWASRCAAERFLRRPRPDSPCRGDGLGPSREELLRPSSLRIPSISASSASLFAIRFSSASSRSLCLFIGRLYTTGGLVLTNLLELERVPIFRSWDYSIRARVGRFADLTFWIVLSSGRNFHYWKTAEKGQLRTASCGRNLVLGDKSGSRMGQKGRPLLHQHEIRRQRFSRRLRSHVRKWSQLECMRSGCRSLPGHCRSDQHVDTG